MFCFSPDYSNAVCVKLNYSTPSQTAVCPNVHSLAHAKTHTHTQPHTQLLSLTRTYTQPHTLTHTYTTTDTHTDKSHDSPMQCVVSRFNSARRTFGQKIIEDFSSVKHAALNSTFLHVCVCVYVCMLPLPSLSSYDMKTTRGQCCLSVHVMSYDLVSSGR